MFEDFVSCCQSDLCVHDGRCDSCTQAMRRWADWCYARGLPFVVFEDPLFQKAMTATVKAVEAGARVADAVPSRKQLA